jgi:hypothetical protein
MRTPLESVQEIQAIVTELEKDVADLELATKSLVGLHLGEALDVNASLGVRQRIKFITAAIVSIT